jgi:hypothetical protein
MQPHALSFLKIFRDAESIVFDRKADFAIGRSEADENVFGFAMFDGVVHRFLSDAVKMRGHGRIMDAEQFVHSELALHLVKVFDLGAEILQRGNQAVGFELNDVEPSSQLAGVRESIIDELMNLGGLRSFGRSFGREPLFEHFAQEGDAGELLAEPVVQIIANAALLPVGDCGGRFPRAICGWRL